MKSCSKITCTEQNPQPLESFYKNGNGLTSHCKACKKISIKRWSQENQETVKARLHRNRDRINELAREGRKKSPERYKEYSARTYQKRSTKIKKYIKEWRQNNPDKCKQMDRKWRNENRQKLNALARNWHKNNPGYKKKRLATDPKFVLVNRLRNRLGMALKFKNFKKEGRTLEHIGCNAKFLLKHIESLFKPGMSWDKRHEFHIDHIIPLSSAKTEEELYNLCHYTNLQPLWAAENRAKSDLLPEQWAEYLSQTQNNEIVNEKIEENV